MEVKTKECPKCGKIVASIYPTQLAWNFDMHVKSCKAKGENQVIAENHVTAIAKHGRVLTPKELGEKINKEIREE